MTKASEQINFDQMKARPSPQEWIDEYKTFPKTVETMQDFYFWTDKMHGSKPYLGFIHKDSTVKWVTRHEVHLMALSVGTKLVELGIPEGSRIGVYSESRVEAAVFLEAAQIYGYIPIFSFDADIDSYPGFVYNDAECSVMYVSHKKLIILDTLDIDRIEQLKYIVIHEFPDFEDEDYKDLEIFKDKMILLSEFIGRTDDFAAAPQIKPTTIDTICYSSGTAGAPKGVVISHGSMLHAVYNILCALDVRESIVHISFLPIAHILERLTLSVIMYRGGKIVFAKKGVNSAFQDMVLAHATGGPNIPFVVTKMYETICKKVPSFLLNGCLAVHKFCSFFGFRSRITDLILFNKIQKAFGGHLEWYAVAGDIFSAEVQTAVSAILNMDLINIYGLSECSGAVAITNRRDVHPGTVGCLVPGFDIKFVKRNEIMIRGPTLFDGYWRNPEITAECMIDGWFRSGDEGALDSDHNLIIKGRAYNSFEYKPGCALALPFLVFTYRESGFFIDAYLEYFEEGNSIIGILVASEKWVKYALQIDGFKDDDEFYEKANSTTYCEWIRKNLRIHARKWGLRDAPYIGAVRHTIKPFNEFQGLLTATGKQRPHMFRQTFEEQLREMKEEVLERRKRKNILKREIMEYSDEDKMTYAQNDDNEEVDNENNEEGKDGNVDEGNESSQEDSY